METLEPWAHREWRPGMYPPVIISVALTGAIPSPQKYPQLPTTPQEIAEQALECAQVGASIVHLHMRDSNGRPSQNPERFHETISLIRAHNSELVICATTTSRGSDNLNERLSPLSLPQETLPDLVSLTLGSYNTPHGVNTNPEDGIIAIARAAARRGVALEAEIFEPGMIHTFYRLHTQGSLEKVALFNVLLGVHGASAATVFSLTQMVQHLPPGIEWAAAGIGHFQKPMVAAALIMGGNVRVGMEDDPRGERANWTNVDSVKRAVSLASALNRPVESPQGARSRLGLR